MTVTVAPVTGGALADVLPALARLRITVFRDFPYLYDGDPAYEAAYLADFAAAAGAVIVVARDGSEIVGAATAAPLATQDTAWRAPLAAAGFDITRTFYFGESVLRGEYRGRGIGHAFFDHREAQARTCGATAAAFCSVVRAADHPARPADHPPARQLLARPRLCAAGGRNRFVRLEDDRRRRRAARTAILDAGVLTSRLPREGGGDDLGPIADRHPLHTAQKEKGRMDRSTRPFAIR